MLLSPRPALRDLAEASAVFGCVAALALVSPAPSTLSSSDASRDARFAARGADNDVPALAWDGTSLYLSTGGSIKRWDGVVLADVGQANDGVNALAWDGTGLVAGGGFDRIGGVQARHVARWSGTSWR